MRKYRQRKLARSVLLEAALTAAEQTPRRSKPAGSRLQGSLPTLVIGVDDANSNDEHGSQLGAAVPELQRDDVRQLGLAADLGLPHQIGMASWRERRWPD